MSKRIPIIIQGMEENPRLTRNARKKMNALGKAQGQLQTVIQKYVPVGKEQERIMAHINRAAFEQEVAIRGKAQPALKLLNASLRDLDKEGRKQIPLMYKLGKGIEKWGFRIGWLGFRLVIVGRMILRFMTTPIQKAVGLLTNWEKTLQEVAISLGLLEASGLLTASMSETLYSVLEDLPEAAMDFKGAIGALIGVLARIAIDIGPLATDAILTLAGAFADVYKEIGPELIGILSDMKDDILPGLVKLIRDFVPPFVKGFVEGMGTAVPLMVKMVEAIIPFAEPLGKIVGFLVPFAPLLMGAGMALYFLQPFIIAVKAAWWLLHGAWVAVNIAMDYFLGKKIAVQTTLLAYGSSSTTAASGFALLAAKVLLCVAAIALLVIYKDEIVAAQEAFAEWAFGGKKGAKKASEAIEQSMWDIEQSTHILENVGWAEEWNKALNSMDKAIASTGEWFLSLFEGSPIPDFIEWLDKAQISLRKTTARLRETGNVMGGFAASALPTFGGGAIGGAQTITIERIDITIERVEGVADLDMVTDAVSHGVAESLRRRLR